MIDIYDIIQEAVSKNIDIDISACPDFNDGVTYTIDLYDNNGKPIYESERLSYFMSETFIIEEYRKLYQFLVKYEN
jgi:hypothetical protein